MTETAKKKQISISSRLKKAPNTNEVLYHNSTLLLNKTSGFSEEEKVNRARSQLHFWKKKQKTNKQTNRYLTLTKAEYVMIPKLI